MNIAFWQQFNSNHSSRFTVVGEFETVETATKAVEELQALADAIAKWYEENPESQDFRLSNGVVEPTPPEDEFIERYQIDWNSSSVDWWGEISPVTQYERLVFVNGTESDLGAKPFDAILKMLGGKPSIDGVLLEARQERYSQVYVSITCQAPDVSTATQIKEATQRYFAANAEFDRDSSLEHDIFASPWRDYNLGGVYGHSTTSGTIEQDGPHLSFTNMTFFHIGYGLPGLLAYLRAQGCTQVECQLIEKKWGEEE